MASQQRANCWSVTINNPIKADEENIQLARQKGWKVEGQLEKGEQGTPHYQLMVKTPQVRFSAVKKQFPRAHIEVARNVSALSQYVTKEDTRTGSLPETSEKYPSLAKLWDLFQEWHDKRPNTEVDEDLLIDVKQIANSDQRLEHFDQFIADAIVRGYHVETMGVNPQIRACVKNYMYQLLKRSRIVRRQTDRQTDENVVCVDTITDEGTEEGHEEATSSASPSCDTTSTSGGGT